MKTAKPLISKNCAYCGEEIVRKKCESTASLRARITCGRECASQLRHRAFIDAHPTATAERHCPGCGVLLVKSHKESWVQFGVRQSCGGGGCRKQHNGWKLHTKAEIELGKKRLYVYKSGGFDGCIHHWLLKPHLSKRLWDTGTCELCGSVAEWPPLAWV